MTKPPITGMLLGYSLICPRKAWLSQRGLWMEQESEAVQIGRLIDQTSYSRAPKQLDLEAELSDGTRLIGRVDWAELREGVLHETKKGKACEEAHRWQLRFYLWLLRLCGVNRTDGQPFTGMLNYPRLRRTERVGFESQHEEDLSRKVHELTAILQADHPPERCSRRSFCKQCAFEELCYG